MTVRHFNLTVTGPPQGQGRPKFSSRGGTPRAYTPAKTRSYAQQVQTEWIAAGRPTLPDGPYRLSIAVHHERPAGHFLRDGGLSAAGARAQYPGKPDLDNVVKGILDALVACGAIPDDRHLVSLSALKLWAEGDPPRVVVDVMTFAEDTADALGLATAAALMTVRRDEAA